MAIIKTNLIRIGNSQGIRIPKPIIEQCGLQGEVELEVKADRLIVKAVSVSRKGWEHAFRNIGDDLGAERLSARKLGPPEGGEWEW